MLKRREFLRLFALATGSSALAGCGAMVTPEDGDAIARAQPDVTARPDVVAPTHDGSVLLDAARDVSVDSARTDDVVITQAFNCTLEDRNCSGHNHAIRVEARVYRRDEVVRYMDRSSHLVEFNVDQLIALRDGLRIPFATTGPFPGHAHCGLAFRSELGATMPAPTERCAPTNTMGMCTR